MSHITSNPAIIGAASLLYALPFLALAMVSRWIPRIWDNFYIRAELQRICFALSLDVSSYVAGSVILAVMGSDNQFAWIVRVVQSNLIFAAQFLCMMVATKWVNVRMEPIIERNKFSLVNIEESRMPLIAVRSKT